MKAFSKSPTAAADEVEAARSFLARASVIIDAKLHELVPVETRAPTHLHQAIRWSLFAGGKRLRPALLLAAGEAFGATHDGLLRSACAFEMVHTYSLIHDDLPAMDDDSLRRGRSTCHVQFGEATAILAGDALQTLAFGAIAEDENLDSDKRVRVISELARAAGTPDGMIAGQCYDLAAESRSVSVQELETIHQHKTGALIRACARCGAIIAGASEHDIENISAYAAHLGLLFQITDDLLDVTSTAEDLGKTPGKDARSQKATYPALYGIEKAHSLAERACEEACAHLDRIETPTPVLRSIARFVLARTT
ncbi:MAG: polyprenyl synthetase family protein [Pyrinomonadaceae bacterium]|nr:polyprenyl synthetase family protein [Pyrinomonadaceae bacterium]